MKCPTCSGKGTTRGFDKAIGNFDQDCSTCAGSGQIEHATFAPSALTDEQRDASTERPGESHYDMSRRQLDHAKNPTPGTTVWRGEVRHKSDLDRPPTVGLHWSTNPGMAIHSRDVPKDHHNVLWEARIDNPATQAIPRSHRMWSGIHRSMDSEMEVRLKPGAHVHVTRGLAWHGEAGGAPTPWPEHPERTAGGWKEHRVDAPSRVAHRPVDTGVGTIDYQGVGIKHEGSASLDGIGRIEHPNVDHYQSGGIGHRDGDESRSIVGFLPTHVVRSYREHGGDWRGDDSKDKVAKIRADLEAGKGLSNPVQMEYDHKEKWAYVGEGNHRVEAAHQAGLSTVPVRVYARGSNGGKKSQGIGGPAKMTTDFGHNGFPYVPPEAHPDHFEFPGGSTHDWSHTAAREEPWDTNVHGDRDEWMKRTQDDHAAHLEAHRSHAEQSTNGYMVSPEGKAAGVKAEDFFKPGNRRTIERWGTPEMKAWHGSESAAQIGEKSRLGKMPSLTEYRRVVRDSERGAYQDHVAQHGEHESTDDYSNGFDWGSRTGAVEAALSDEARVSVAEKVMEDNGHSGQTWHVPKMHQDDPERREAHKPVHDFVHHVLTSHGWESGGPGHGIRVMPKHWDLREPGSGQAITDGMNYIGLKGEHTNDLTLLHECAHVLTGTSEGTGGHGPEFQETAKRLYHDHLSPDAAEMFGNLTRKHKTAATHPGPHYHGTSADLSPGDLVEPSKHPRSHNPWGEDTAPREHTYFSPRKDYVTEHYGPNVYEVEPTGDYAHDPEYDNRRMFRSPHPLKVVRQVSKEWGTPHTGAVMDTWSPSERLFAPTKGGVDPRLFHVDTRVMLARVRLSVVVWVNEFFDRHGYNDAGGWKRTYLAGSQASEWYGNNDFDILVGIQYDAFRRMHPDLVSLSDQQIGDRINAEFRADFNDEQWHPPFDRDNEWHLTGYVFLAQRDKFMPHESVLTDSLGEWRHDANSLPSSRTDSLSSTETTDSPRPTSQRTSASTSSPCVATSNSPESRETPVAGDERWSDVARRPVVSAAPQMRSTAVDATTAPERRIGSTTSPAPWVSPSSSMMPRSNDKAGSVPSVESQANFSRWTTTMPAARDARPVASASVASSALGATDLSESSVTTTSPVLSRTSRVEPADPYDTMDIRNIKPYAAYNVTDNVWAVEPIHEPTGHHFNDTEMYYFEGVAAQVRAALALREPNRRVRCTQLWTFVHTDRSRAFGPDGAGAFDRGNALEKYLDQAPSTEPGKSLMAALAEAKFGQVTAASAAPHQRFFLPEGGGKYHRANPITGQAMCRGTVLLDTTAMPFMVPDDAVKVHPMVCRKCLGKDHPANAPKTSALVPSDLDRAHDVIRHYQLKGPSDGPGEFTWPKHPDKRRDLADFIYDQTDEHAGRAVLDAPDKMRTTWEHQAPGMDKTAGTAHNLYGRNDLHALFGKNPLTTAPWAPAGRLKDEPMVDQDHVNKVVFDPDRSKHMDEVDPRDLRSTQGGVTRAGVDYYMGEHYRQTGETYKDGHQAGNQVPVIYSKKSRYGSGTQHIILSGHHRAAAALLKGEKLQCIHIYHPGDEQEGHHEQPVRDAVAVHRRGSLSTVPDGEGDHGQRGPGGDPVGAHRRLAAGLLGDRQRGADGSGGDPAADDGATALRQDGLAVEAWYQSEYPPDHPRHRDEEREEFQPDSEGVKDELHRLSGGVYPKRSELHEHMANGTVPKHLYRAISETDFHRAKSQGYLDTHGESNWMRPEKGEHAEGMVTATNPHEVARTYLPDEGGRVVKIETHPEHGWRPHDHDYVPRWQTKTHDTKVPWEHVVDHSAPIERRFNPDTWSTQDAVQMKGEGHEPADHATADNLDYFKRVTHPAFHHLHPYHPDHGKTAAKTAGLFGPPWFAAAHDDDIEAHHTPEALRMGMTHHTSPQGHTYRLTADDRTVYAAYLGKGEQRIKKPQMVGTLNWFGGRATPDDTTIKGRIGHIFVKPAHQRRGLASAMLDHARQQNPHDDIEHSTNLSNDAKGWSSVKASKAQSIEVAGVAIKANDTGRVLMLQRSFEDKKDPARGTWEFPGGHIDEGENPFEAARREWGEETGGTFPDDAPVVGNWISGGMYQGFVVVIAKEADLEINLDHEDRKVLNPDDPDGDGIEVVAWWSLDHLKDNPAVRKEVAKGTDWDLLKKAKSPGTTKKSALTPPPFEEHYVVHERAAGPRQGGQERRGLGEPRGGHRGASSRGLARAAGAAPGPAGGPGGLTWHPQAAKDLKRLDGPVRKQLLGTIDSLQSGDPTTLAQTHPLTGPMKGWYATKASRGHRIIHRPGDGGGTHIGYVGLHEYDKAIQRLT